MHAEVLKYLIGKSNSHNPYSPLKLGFKIGTCSQIVALKSSSGTAFCFRRVNTGTLFNRVKNHPLTAESHPNVLGYSFHQLRIHSPG